MGRVVSRGLVAQYRRDGLQCWVAVGGDWVAGLCRLREDGGLAGVEANGGRGKKDPEKKGKKRRKGREKKRKEEKEKKNIIIFKGNFGIFKKIVKRRVL